MYDELIKALRGCVLSKPCDDCPYYNPNGPTKECATMNIAAADVIEELTAKVESLQFFADNISKLPDCNTCLKKNLCEFMPKYGEYCRINCPAWIGQPPKEE